MSILGGSQQDVAFPRPVACMNGECIREADETMGRFLFVPFLLKEKGPPLEAKTKKKMQLNQYQYQKRDVYFCDAVI